VGGYEREFVPLNEHDLRQGFGVFSLRFFLVKCERRDSEPETEAKREEKEHFQRSKASWKGKQKTL
jgi:hypothetical protein